ncbi:MAG: extensin family protein, partial [Burkholderiales bacterium]
MRGLRIILAATLGLGGCIDAPQAAKREPIRRSTVVLSPRPETRLCLASLGRRSARFTPIPDQFYGAGCSTLGTVRLASLQSDNAALALSNLGPVTCPLANSFAGWARFGVDRAAQQILGSALVRIETMGSYSCRNVAGSSHRSAHA